VSEPAADESEPPTGVAAGIGVLLLLLAALVVVDAQRLPPASALGVGPAAAMRLVAALLALLGAAHLVSAWRQRRSYASPSDVVPANRAALAWVVGALTGLMLVLQLGGGFIVASAWLFALTARGFGAPLGAKSVGIGILLSTLVYFFFTKALSLGLPAGPLERLLS
jgi:putative tricarboxylic transport membrane protein